MNTILDTLPAALTDYVFSDYQENVYYNGHEPAESVDVLRPYWEEYVTDRQTIGYPVPEGLTPELYCEIWNAWYEVRTAIEREVRRNSK